MALWPAADDKPHLQVGYIAAPTSKSKKLKKPLANGEPSIHGPISVAYHERVEVRSRYLL